MEDCIIKNKQSFRGSEGSVKKRPTAPGLSEYAEKPLMARRNCHSVTGEGEGGTNRPLSGPNSREEV